MTTFRQQLALALIAATAAILAAGVPDIMRLGKKSPLESSSVTATSTTCDKVTVAKVCVDNLTVQFNSNEPQQVKNSDRIPLKAGDTLRLSNLTYCIPSKASVNRVEVKVYLFPNGVESYKNGLSTPSNFPINAACHSIGNFQQTWMLEPGQHRVSIPIIKYVGGNRIVENSFYFNLDVGR
ncbi:hypothetical protein [Nostoc sp. UHCC 0252]|uniref:hypothetical protein n=1 Tax=Nostoc sp. UHCC 0252 TaxID=3110241 RepID=UPI002B1EB841|nr:hypothetical protein [Nostoc sp. UHCC 0252]MEA5599607.1 hypothetical protein [Nostoc sp. UHCC 0252]